MIICVTPEHWFLTAHVIPSYLLLAITQQSSDPNDSTSSKSKSNLTKTKYIWLQPIKVTPNSLVSLIGIPVLFNAKAFILFMMPQTLPP